MFYTDCMKCGKSQLFFLFLISAAFVQASNKGSDESSESGITQLKNSYDQKTDRELLETIAECMKLIPKWLESINKTLIYLEEQQKNIKEEQKEILQKLESLKNNSFQETTVSSLIFEDGKGKKIIDKKNKKKQRVSFSSRLIMEQTEDIGDRGNSTQKNSNKCKTSGENPLKVGKSLSDKFKQYKGKH
jgi:hypothetical protein